MARVYSFNNKQAIEEPQINLTALIDVVFVMLIMFILIAPLLELERIELAEASKHSKDPALSAQEASPLSIHVQKDNSIWINKEQVKLPLLVEKLKKAKSLYPKVRPQLFQDKNAVFGTYQTVKNALEEAGYHDVDLILKPT